MESADGLKQLLEAFAIAMESERARQLMSYLALLEKWNKRVNLTATTAWGELELLFQEGIWASKFYPSNALTHLDIGSGAGFPGIILKILVPRIRLEMVESRVKKSIFLETAIRGLGMDGTRVHPGRLDAFLSRSSGDKVWDCVSWKGLKLSSGDLLQLCKHAHAGTQFWMFHGRQPAVVDPEMLALNFKLLRSERFPARREWALSIYQSSPSRARGRTR